MTRSIRRFIFPFLCAALLSGGTLAQLAVTAEPAAAATPVASFSLSSNQPASVTGQAVIFAVSLTGATTTPTGTVIFLDGVDTICATQPLVIAGPFATASCTTSTLTIGTHPVTATYSGNATYDPATSNTVSQVVSKASTTTAVSSGTNPSVFSGSVVFTASVLATAPGTGTPTGTVAFKAGGVDIAGCATKTLVAATTTCTTTALPVGTPSIAAVYSGDASYLTSTSASTTQTVAKADTTTVVTSSDTTTSWDEAVTYTATISPTSPATAPPSAGTVSFKVDGTAITGCTTRPVAGGLATCVTTSEPVGTPSITAVFSGDTSYNTSTSAAATQTVSQSATSTTLSSGTNPSVFSGPVVFTASVLATAPGGGTPTGNVAFKAGGVDISGCAAKVLVSGTTTCTTTVLAVGDHAITAAYAATTNYLTSTSAPTTQTVAKADTTTVVTSSGLTTNWNEAVTFTANISPVSPATLAPSGGTVSFNVDGTPISACAAQPVVIGVASCVTSTVPVGARSVNAVYSGDTSFNTSTSSAIVQTVSKAATITALASNHNPSRSGQAVTLTATITSTAGTPTGTVSFFLVRKDSTHKLLATSTVTAGAVSMTTASLPVRFGSIIAEYNGDPNFAVSTTTFAQTVSRSFSRTGMRSSANPSTIGHPFTIRVAVESMGDGSGTPTGVVALYRVRANSSRQWIGRGILRAGVATITISGTPLGIHRLVAEYRGSVFHRPSSRSMRQYVDVSS